MRISKEQIINGAKAYVKNELMPNIPNAQSRTVIGTAVNLFMQNDTAISNMLDNGIVAAAVNAENGMYDTEALFNALSSAVSEYGNLVLTIPKIPLVMAETTLSFSASDIDRIRAYVERGGV